MFSAHWNATAMMFLYAFLLSAVHSGKGASVLQRSGVDLTKRAYQSEAACQDQYGWMDNSETQSPCQVLAYVVGACLGPSFTVNALPNVSDHYDAPGTSALEATTCSCSWSSYNLFQACTICQGADEASISNWDPWISECTNLVPPDPFPKTITLSNSTSIPAWAITDPDTWANHRFDVVAAQNTANQHKPDFVPSPVSPASHNNPGKTFPVGAVVGGVVGGVVMLVIAATAVFIYKRRRRRGDEGTQAIPTDKGDIGDTHQYQSKPAPLFHHAPAGSSVVLLSGTMNGPMTSSSGFSSLGISTPGPMVHPAESEGYFPPVRDSSAHSIGLQSTPPSAYQRHSMMSHSPSFSQDSTNSALYTHLGSMSEGPENRIDPFIVHSDLSFASGNSEHTPDMSSVSSIHLPGATSSGKRQMLQPTTNTVPSRSSTPALSQVSSTPQTRWNPPTYDEATAESASQSSHQHTGSIGSISTVSPDNRRVSNSLQGMVSAIREESESRELPQTQSRTDRKR